MICSTLWMKENYRLQQRFINVSAPRHSVLFTPRRAQMSLRNCLFNLALFVLSAVSISLTGCGMSANNPVSEKVNFLGAHFKGDFHGGQQPIVGLTVQLYAAGSTGYGSSYPYTSGASLLGANVVITDAYGSFHMTGDYICPTAATEVYLVGTGGKPIAGQPANPNLAMMAALGPCGNLSSSTFISVNEVTTIGTVYALSPFMTGIANIGTSAGNSVGLVNAFSAVNKLVDIGAGTVSGPALPIGATLPISEINTLADIIEACINSSGGVAGDGSICGKLFSLTPSAGVFPTDTITAAMNIAHNPSQNAAALNNLSSGTSSFQPILGNAPPVAWTIAVRYTANASLSQPMGVAADQAGNIWIANLQSNSVSELATSGAVLSGAGYAKGQSGLGAIAIDQSGNAWVPANTTGSILKVISSGGSYSSYTGGGLGITSAIAVDGQGQIWATGENNLSAFTNAGTAVSPASGFTGGGASNPQSIAITPY
jgi:hypothetical protein